MENPQQPGRRAFLSQTGKLTTACAVIGLTGGMAQAASPGDGQCAPAPMTLTDRHYCLSEVRLEDGFENDGETVIGTRTALYTLEIKDGKIAAIHAANASLPAGVPRYQAQGQLLLPAFRDMHIHRQNLLQRPMAGAAPAPWQDHHGHDRAGADADPETAAHLAAAGGKPDRPAAVQRQHCGAQPLQYRSGQRPEKPEHLQRALETTGRISAVKSSPSRSTACCTPWSMR